MKHILGIDIDGVIANWNKAFHQILINETGKDLVPADKHCLPDIWDWPSAYGYTKDEQKQCYEKSWNNGVFWNNLEPLPDALALIDGLAEGQIYGEWDVYFVTTRPGALAKTQTEEWFYQYGFPGSTVLLGQSPAAKGHIAAGLGMTHFIDDRPENCLAVRFASPQTQVFLLDCSWNRSAQDLLKYNKVTVVGSVLEFLEKVKA